jgi:hypothetical protein
LEDKAERTRREISFEKERKQFLGSDAGVQAARTSIDALLNGLEERSARLSLTFKRAKQPGEACVIGQAVGAMLYWHREYGNSLDGSYLDTSIWNGHPPMSTSYFPFQPPKRITGTKYLFDLTPAGEHVWKPSGGRHERAFSENLLADEIVSALLDRERDAHKRRA